MRSRAKLSGARISWFLGVLAAFALVASQLVDSEPAPSELAQSQLEIAAPDVEVSPSTQPQGELSEARLAIDQLQVKGRAPKTGYSRDQFSNGWGRIDGCDLRNLILQRDLIEQRMRDDCIVESGLLLDPYTGTEIEFVRGVDTSAAVQIDHVVALSDAWQKGAQQLDADERFAFHNDPLNLLAVSGPANQQKSDSDAASWLPANRGFRCDFVARQVAVKLEYRLWVTQAERDAMIRVLDRCPDQRLPSR